MSILRAACTYFGLVFGTGFVLGALRVTLLLPRLGERTAELLEMPLMTVAMVLAARSVVRRQLRGAGPGSLVTTGGIALALLLLYALLPLLLGRGATITAVP
jgi:hypothetical protein